MLLLIKTAVANNYYPHLIGGAEATDDGEITQGGSGQLKVLLITKGHKFERDAFFKLFDLLGKEITYTHVDQPAAQIFFDPKIAAQFDVFVFYDMPGYERKFLSDGTSKLVPADPDPLLKTYLQELLKQGKGLLFIHHAIAGWAQQWPEYSEMIGGSCDWLNSHIFRGKHYPKSGYKYNVKHHMTVVKQHPVVQGLGNSFDILDEGYLCPYAEDSFTTLVRTDFNPIDSNFTSSDLYPNGWRHPKGSNATVWVKSVQKSPLVYIQPGNGPAAWNNPVYQRLLKNAILWLASEDAKQWVTANAKQQSSK